VTIIIEELKLGSGFPDLLALLRIASRLFWLNITTYRKKSNRNNDKKCVFHFQSGYGSIFLSNENTNFMEYK